MRSIGILCLLAVTAWALPAAGGERFPYTAYITGENVYVRSGPGRNYYPTDKLDKNAIVEVYRHDPGGWCAVRPPEGSYSWVSARYVELSEADLGVITGDQVVARIGSKFSSVRDVIQVRLERGEVVEILGKRDSGEQTWYKVAPPAGEFRWISSRYLAQQPDEGISRPLESGDLRSRSQAAQADENRPGGVSAEIETARAQRIPVIEREGTAQTASYKLPRAFGQTKPTHQPVRVASRTATAAPGRKKIAGFFDQAVKDVELEISTMVAEEPTVWTFRELRRYLDDMMSEAATAVERGEVRRLQSKIERLEGIQSRYEAISSLQEQTDRTIDQLENQGIIAAARAAASNPQAPQAGLQTAPAAQSGAVDPQVSGVRPPEPNTLATGGFEPAYDGKGTLRPVISRRKEAPRYALVDEEGLVLSFVSPAPGVNLQPYVGQQIGVVGMRGFMPELKKPHVMVKSISPLSPKWR